MTGLHDFLAMGGYGFYVWSAYGCVLVFLLAQWFFPWRRLHKQIKFRESAIDHTHLDDTKNVGFEVDLDDFRRGKAQRTRQYVSIFPVENRSKIPKDRRFRNGA